MAGPLLALGKIVSSVVSASAKGLTVAGKATAKTISKTDKAIGKALNYGVELAYEAGSAAKPRLIKGVKATTKELKKIASATQKSMSNFGKRMSNRKTGTEKLKRDANKIKSKHEEFIVKDAQIAGLRGMLCDRIDSIGVNTSSVSTALASYVGIHTDEVVGTATTFEVPFYKPEGLGNRFEVL